MRTRLVLVVMLVAVAFLASYPAGAGQFKRLDVSALAPGGQRAAWSSPQNQGNAMEMDVYEFLTGPGLGNTGFRCRITANNTGRRLTLRLIGVDGSNFSSCTTPVNGTCNLPYASLVGNLLFQCTVATGNVLPVAVGSRYVLTVQRQPGAPLGSSAFEEDVELTDPSGVAKSIR